MVPNLSNRLILGAASIVAVIGVIDSAIGRQWDLLVVFSLVLALQLLLWAHISWGRPAVPLRADLVRWMSDRAVAGGEPVGRVGDRAVAAYRAGLTGSDPDNDA